MTDSPNLLPHSVQNHRYVVVWLKRWSVVWLATAMVTTWFGIARQRHLLDLKLTAAHLAAEAAPIRDLKTQCLALNNEISIIRERESWLTDSESHQMLQLLGIISSATAAADGRINVQSLALAQTEPPPQRSTKPTAPRQKKQPDIPVRRTELSLNGFAVDDLAVASFVAGLREAGVFESVELKSSAGQILNNHETRQYDVLCVY